MFLIETVESRTTTEDIFPAETLSPTINPHPSFSSAEKVVFLTVSIYQYFPSVCLAIV